MCGLTRRFAVAAAIAFLIGLAGAREAQAQHRGGGSRSDAFRRRFRPIQRRAAFTAAPARLQLLHRHAFSFPPANNFPRFSAVRRRTRIRDPAPSSSAAARGPALPTLLRRRHQGTFSSVLDIRRIESGLLRRANSYASSGYNLPAELWSPELFVAAADECDDAQYGHAERGEDRIVRHRRLERRHGAPEYSASGERKPLLQRRGDDRSGRRPRASLRDSAAVSRRDVQVRRARRADGRRKDGPSGFSWK